MSAGVIPACAGNKVGAVAVLFGSVGSSLRVRGTVSVSWSAIESSCQIQPL